MKRKKIKSAKLYHCPECDAVNSIYPIWRGRRRFYQCIKCETNYSSTQLDKSWGVAKQKNILEVLKF